MTRTIAKYILGGIAALALVALFTAPSMALEIKRIRLANGAILLVSEQHQLPMVTMSIAFDAGARRDPKGREGLAALTAAALTQGTQTLSAAQFNQKVEFMGSSISVSGGRDYAVASFTSLKKYTDDTLHLMVQALRSPGLRDADIERKRADQIVGIKASEEQPEYTAGVAFAKQLFGDEPYGHPVEGLADTVGKLKPADVRGFYRDYYKIDSAVIAVAGDVDTDTIKQKLEREFTGLTGAVPPQPLPPAPVVAPGIHAKLVDRNVAQATIVLGAGGIARSNPDYYKLEVMNYILGGGGFASRLMRVVRSKAGLVYGIESLFEAQKFAGPFLVAAQTKNVNANRALKLIFQQLHEIQNAPVSDAELAAAKKFLIGSFPLKVDRQSQIVGFMLDIELNQLGLDYADRYPKLIDGVTREDVQKVAQQYIHPGALDLVVVANQSVAKIDAASLEERKPAAAATP